MDCNIVDKAWIAWGNFALSSCQETRLHLARLLLGPWTNLSLGRTFTWTLDEDLNLEPFTWQDFYMDLRRRFEPGTWQLAYLHLGKLLFSPWIWIWTWNLAPCIWWDFLNVIPGPWPRSEPGIWRYFYLVTLHPMQLVITDLNLAD